MPVECGLGKPVYLSRLVVAGINQFQVKCKTVIRGMGAQGTVQGIITASRSWSDFTGQLGKLGNDQTTLMGRAFEDLTVLYLRTHPTYKTKLAEVWHHTEIPQAVLDELGLQRPEIGVDLVARAREGSYWAIQCKYHSNPSRNVTYREVSTFFSITERETTAGKLSHRLVCTSAWTVSPTVAKNHSSKLAYVTSDEFAKLGSEQFLAYHRILAGQTQPLPERYMPRPHQEQALSNCHKYFHDQEHTRGKLIHPCGSGKSLTGYWCARDLQARTVLIAVPSLALVRQTLDVWTRETIAHGEEIDWIAVCSDQGVSRMDDPAMQTTDLGIQVDTDPEVIAKFFAHSRATTKVLITTYQSSRAVTAAVTKADISFDVGIYDEAHKTVGRKDKVFAHLLYDENVSVRKRIFMTATERQFRGNSDDVVSMDDEGIYGKVFDELSFKQALEQNPPILSDYKVVSIGVTKAEIENLINRNAYLRSDGTSWSAEHDASTFASLIVLQKIVKQKNLKHIVSFHSRIHRAREFEQMNTRLAKTVTPAKGLTSFHVSGKQGTGERAAVLERFTAAEPSLLTNARCLTEGVDVPAIDGVLFADPKRSKIDIVQAAGRALRRFSGKKYGYIIIPVVIDEESGDPKDDAFEQIITVISALGMHDERIIEEFKSIQTGRSSRTDIFEIDIPDSVTVKFDNLIENIKIEIWDRLSFGWHKGFEKLKEYVAINGDSKVPFSYCTTDGFKLGSWVRSRRRDFKQNRLSQEKIELLRKLSGWDFFPFETNFAVGFEHLKKYVAKEGNAHVPQGHETKDGYKLGKWVANKRVAFNNGYLTQEHIQQLEVLPGWTFYALEANFAIGLEHLKKYVAKEGNAHVPQGHETKDGYKLGKWVANKRVAFNNGYLTQEHIQQLEVLPGWTFYALEANFAIGLEHLKKYVAKEGNARVKRKYQDQDGFKLGQWVHNKREKQKKGILTQEKIQQLKALPGWD